MTATPLHEMARRSGRPSQTVSEAVVDALNALGVSHAFGVSGGAIAPLWGALSASKIKVVHFRHETGAAFAAIEAHFATNAPVVVFTTTGPGLTNVLTGMLAARGEGAKIILVSACTTAAYRGRGAIQETDSDTMPLGLTAPGALFHSATVIESVESLPQVFRRVANGLARPGGFVCHLSVPTGLQTVALTSPMPTFAATGSPNRPDDSVTERCAALLTEVALWLGYGARAAADGIQSLAERLGAAVMCSPRAKGVFPENHPLFVGVTGMGGHDAVEQYMRTCRPRRTLVLGTRLGEPTSFWNPALVPAEGFIHVDIDPDVPGVAYPTAETLPVCADIGQFVGALLERLPAKAQTVGLPWALPSPVSACIEPTRARLIRPEALMAAIQRVVVDGHDCLVLAESGNSFAWATHSLRFSEAGRYRVSTGVGSMGHCAAGVVGAALASNRPAVAIVGDGAMLMNNEVNTAVKFGAPAIWVVLNDSRYNMCEQGMGALGLEADARIPEVDFAMLAKAMGAAGEIVESEFDLDRALKAAILAKGPYVLDIRIDPTCPAPSMARNRGLRALGVGAAPLSPDVSFPPRH